jgi:hypothetical protein
VDQSAEQVAPADAIELDHLGQWLLRAQRWPLPERPVRPMFVEMPDVRDEHVLEVAAAEDQQSVEALAPNAADPAFPSGTGARPARPAAAATNTQARGPRPKNDPPPPLTLPISCHAER